MTLLASVVDTYQRVASTRSRTAKLAALAEQLIVLDHEEVEVGVHFLSGQLSQGKIGIGYGALKYVRMIPATTPELSLTELDQTFERLGKLSGAGSSRARREGLEDLFARLTGAEQGFVFSLLLGELRQGALEGLMTDAVARAAQLPLPAVRQAAMFAGDLGRVARIALEEGAVGLERFRLRLFSPVTPMLAQTAEDVQAALDQVGEAAFEWKLDGARVQVHRLENEVRVYSRAGNDVTAAVPEVVEAVQRLPVQTLILDGEAIALDRKQRPLPFQLTMRRFSRKSKVEELRSQLPLSVFFFDCLRLEERDLVALPAHERFAALREILPAPLLIPRIVTKQSAEAQDFYEGALARGHEGVMAKSLEACYEAGDRGGAWLKVKRSHTLDLVVLAAEWGNGRRQGWLSNLHLGARDDSGKFVMLGKTFKGLSDEMLEWQTQELLKRESRREGQVVYVKPELVVEIAFSDIQTSPRYPGGLALRFARVKRYREDKSAADADSVNTVRTLFKAQAAHGYA